MASEIRVNKINSRTGVGTITLSPTGVDFTGIATVATLKATTGIVTTLTVDTAKTTTGIVTTLSVTGNATVGGTLDITGATTLSGNLDLQDDDKILIGTGDDLEIYHNGSKSFITNNGSTALEIEALAGDLILRGTDNVYIQSGTTDETFFKATVNGSVDLYYDNDLHFATTSDGVKTNGDLSFRGDGDVEQILFDASDASLKFTDGKRAKFGDGADLHIYHDGSNSSIVDFGTGKLLISGNDAIFFQSTGTGDYFAKFNSDAAVELYYDNSKKFETKTDGVVVTGGIYLDGSGGTASANKLDDYEEGTWTVTLNPSGGFTPTSNTSTGYYTKIGRQVTVMGNAIMTIPSSLGTYVNNNTAYGLAVTGLPFTSINASSQGRSAPVLGVTDNINTSGGTLAGHGTANSTQFSIFVNKDNGAIRVSPTLTATESVNIHFCFTYFT